MTNDSNKRLLALLLTLLMVMSFALTACSDNPTTESSEETYEGKTVDYCGLAFSVPEDFTVSGDNVLTAVSGDKRIVWTYSAEKVTVKNTSDLKKISLVQSPDQVEKVTSVNTEDISWTEYILQDKAGTPLAQAVFNTDNGTVCVTAYSKDGAPKDLLDLVLVTARKGEDMKQEEAKKTIGEPLPETMHSSGISPITGTFIQPWLYNSYSEERWEKEMALMKEMGIEYIIMGDTLSISTGSPITDVNQYVITASYATQNPNFKKGGDVLTKLFDKCKKYGMKVYVGMGNTPAGWPFLDLETTGFAELSAVFADVAEDLYNVYYTKYPETFAGFYFVPEMYNSSNFDNEYNRKRYVENLSVGFHKIFDRLNQLNPDLPFIFSPYVNMFGGGWVSKDPNNIEAFWTELLKAAGFRDGDILCPQDSVGAGGNDLNQLEAVTKAYKNAVTNCGKKVQLWTNAEIFIQPVGKFFDNYDSYGNYWTSCSVDRMTEQFKIASKYVDRIFTFAFPHYLSEYNTTDGYMKSYRYYLEHGEVEKTPPTPPTAFKASRTFQNGNPVLQINWAGEYDDFGVHRVNIYKDGELYTFRAFSRNEGSSAKSTLQSSFTVPDFNFDSDSPVTFSFEVIDCSGNVSERSEFTFKASDIPTDGVVTQTYKGPNPISEGIRIISK